MQFYLEYFHRYDFEKKKMHGTVIYFTFLIVYHFKEV